MRLTLKAALLAASFALVPVVSSAPALARATVAFDFGNVAVGYSDGYWDHGHQWHRWQNAGYARQYRTQYHDHYTNKRHDRMPNQGWRDR